MVLLVLLSGCATTKTYKVAVDYNQPLAKVIKAGQYAWVSLAASIYAKENPFDIFEKGKKEVEIHLLHLGRVFTDPGEVYGEMAKRGYEPIGIRELVILGSKYPDLQRKYPIIQLGFTCSNEDASSWAAIALISDNNSRAVGIIPFDDKFPPNARFAAVRK